MDILIQFLFRLAWGMALAMACTSPRQVTSGYFRVHLYVVLGLNTLATLVALAVPEFALWPALSGALASYFGAVAWLYEAALVGRVMLLVVAGLSLVGAWQAAGVTQSASGGDAILSWAEPVTSGLVLGTTMAAMLLGHWYLNTPTMRLEPLKRLIKMLAAAVIAQVGVSLVALVLALSGGETFSFAIWAGVALRWLSGLAGTLGLAWMAWETLKVPNTQSATGILYVAVITTFLGELTSLLLSAEVGLPL